MYASMYECFLVIMAIPLMLWHSNFVKSFLSWISKKWNFQFKKKNVYFSRYRLLRALIPCLYVCILLIVATPFNLQHWNFGIIILTWLSKKGFLNFLKNCFFAELSPFFYISLRFLCNFEEQWRKTNGDKNEILFTHK